MLLFRSEICHPTSMQADKVEISRDEEHKHWLVRIQVGGEVIRRHCDEPSNADQETLKNAAVQTAIAEGYTVDPADVVIR